MELVRCADDDRIEFFTLEHVAVVGVHTRNFILLRRRFCQIDDHIGDGGESNVGMLFEAGKMTPARNVAGADDSDVDDSRGGHHERELRETLCLYTSGLK